MNRQPPIASTLNSDARSTQNKLMQHRPTYHLGLADLNTHSHLGIKWLPFNLKLYLHLANGGAVDVPLSRMPVLDHTSVRLSKGVRIGARTNEPRIALGGAIAYGNVILNPSKLAMVAVKAKGIRTALNPHPSYTIWYGQLVLCFTTHFAGSPLHLCLVRWLDCAAAVSERVVAATPLIRRAAVRATESIRMNRLRKAPFAAYRWEVALGSTAAGHPAAGTPVYGVVDIAHILYHVPMIRAYGSSRCQDDPTFYLNTDMWDL